MVEPFKTCTCCGRTFTRAEWFSLSPVGVTVLSGDGDEGSEREVWDVRNCPEPCVSTLSVAIAKSPTSLVRTLWEHVRPDGSIPYGIVVRAEVLAAIEEHGALVDALAELEERHNALKAEARMLRAERREFVVSDSRPLEAFGETFAAVHGRDFQITKLPENGVVVIVRRAQVGDSLRVSDQIRVMRGEAAPAPTSVCGELP